MAAGDVPGAALNARARIEAAEAAIRAAGYTVRYVEYAEDAHSPGILGMFRGVTDHTRREVKIATRHSTGDEYLAETLEHEQRHVEDPTWDCGNRDAFGRGGPRGPEPEDRCVFCGEPGEFEDGLRCKMCAEKQDAAA